MKLFRNPFPEPRGLCLEKELQPTGQRELSQELLAEMIDIESPSYLSKVENGKSSPSYELLGRLADALGVEVKDLFDTKNKGPKNKNLSQGDKWNLKFRALLKGRNEKDIKKAYAILSKVFSK